MSRDSIIRELQEKFRQAGGSLNELQRRHWAATQAIMLGHGGITIVSQALRMSPNTIKRGIHELTAGPAGSHSENSPRVRRSGGGRKSKTPSSSEASSDLNQRASRRKS